jgi:hypothetical protein
MQIQNQELTISHTMYGNINNKRMHIQDYETRTDTELRVSVKISVSDRREVGRQEEVLYTVHKRD